MWGYIKVGSCNPEGVEYRPPTNPISAKLCYYKVNISQPKSLYICPMPQAIKLSELAYEIQETMEARFEGETFWVTAEISDVKKYISTRRCYLKLVERDGNSTNTELRAVFWANYYNEIELFEKKTKQNFADGIEITCEVKVRFHPKYGLNLDVIKIDVAYTLGTIELERQKTLEKLVQENPKHIKLVEGNYITYNNRLPLPIVIQRVALITAPNSDGQRDFKQELEKNKHGYAFSVTEFLTQIQGDNAHQLILEQLQLVYNNKENFDMVAIVRGGGSQTDFKPFEDYELAKTVANFPIPIYTGIGHDRNTSIVDMMAREHKTPTKVAASIIEHNFEFENSIIELKERLNQQVDYILENAKENIQDLKRLVKLASPANIMKKGFAIITIKDKIIIDPKNIQPHTEIDILLQDQIIYTTVTKKEKNAQRTNL